MIQKLKEARDRARAKAEKLDKAAWVKVAKAEKAQDVACSGLKAACDAEIAAMAAHEAWLEARLDTVIT